MKLRLDDGTQINVKHVTGDWDRHGNLRLYFRDGHGPRVRIRDLSTVENFMTEYRAALTGTAAVPPVRRSPATPGSFRWLVESYVNSGDFLALEARTRKVRRAILDTVTEKHGTKPYARMERRHVYQIVEEKAEFPEAANARLKVLRKLFAWAIDAGHGDQNPTRDVRYRASKNPDGHHTWTVDEVERYKKRHAIGSKAQLALALLLYTGVRRSDVVQLGRQLERDGWLHFTEAKNQMRNPKHRALLMLPELRSIIDATPSKNLTYLVTEFGRPFTANGFGNWFKRRCTEAGLPHCSAHGLRKAGATIAAENGATEHQLMAIYGWSSPKQAALYTRKANRNRIAGDAIHLIVPRQTENENPAPERAVASGAGIRGGKS